MNIYSSNYIGASTIYALSTVFGQSAVSVIRVSGKDALKVVEKFSIKKKIIPKHNHFVILRDVEMILDHCLLLYFKSPNSFTGEDIVELQLHGSRAVIKIILKKLSEIENFVLAEPGEFTKRAFLNKKLDLVQSEGLLALIHSETQEQLFQANKQLSGENSHVFNSVRNDILKIFANCEALLDFPEDDIEKPNLILVKKNSTLIENNILEQLIQIQKKLDKYLDDGILGEKIYNGFKIAIVGKPNVGKSSLLNFLVKKPCAIVSDIPGTTRDLVKVNLNIEGYQVELIDTAGIRETNDIIELMGISKTKSTIEESDLILILSDIKHYDSYKSFIENFDEKKHLLVLNKMDDSEEKFMQFNNKKYLSISVKNEINLDTLLDEIKNRIKNLIPTISPVITSKRQRLIINNLNCELISIIEKFSDYRFLDVLTEDVRNLSKYISQLTGTIVAEDILEELFCNFCIGK